MLLDRYLIFAVIFICHISAIKCTVVIEKQTSDLGVKTFLFTRYSHGGLIPKTTYLHRTLFRAKLDIVKYARKSFPELQLM